MLQIKICEKCNKELSNSKSYRLYKYNQKIHVYLFKCDICSKKFKCQSHQQKKS